MLDTTASLQSGYTTLPTAVGRYAPSPTGPLHLGNVRTALLAWYAARRAGGRFILRIEDLDQPRVRSGATASIIADLRWLGLDWDEGPDVGGQHGPYFQSQRLALYHQALARLRAQDLLYPCYCSRTDLSRLASAPHHGDDPPPYPGTCRDLTHAQRQAYKREGRRPAWRVRVPPGIVTFHDRDMGEVTQDVAAEVGDFIVWRSDDVIAYQLAVVVDDALMGVTEVVRGRDLLHVTPRQIILQQLLGYPQPSYAHVPLLTDDQGEKLSKRTAASGLAEWQSAGYTVEMAMGMLATSAGIVPAYRPLTTRDMLQ